MVGLLNAHLAFAVIKERGIFLQAQLRNSPPETLGSLFHPDIASIKGDHRGRQHIGVVAFERRRLLYFQAPRRVEAMLFRIKVNFGHSGIGGT